MSDLSIEYLMHINDECMYLLSVLDNDLSYDSLINDQHLKRAVVRSLQVIGETSKRIPEHSKARWKSINWRHLTGISDRLIDGHVSVNYIIVWDVIANLIPELTRNLGRVIESEQKFMR